MGSGLRTPACTAVRCKTCSRRLQIILESEILAQEQLLLSCSEFTLRFCGKHILVGSELAGLAEIQKSKTPLNRSRKLRGLGAAMSFNRVSLVDSLNVEP